MLKDCSNNIKLGQLDGCPNVITLECPNYTDTLKWIICATWRSFQKMDNMLDMAGKLDNMRAMDGNLENAYLDLSLFHGHL